MDKLTSRSREIILSELSKPAAFRLTGEALRKTYGLDGTDADTEAARLSRWIDGFATGSWDMLAGIGGHAASAITSPRTTPRNTSTRSQPQRASKPRSAPAKKMPWAGAKASDDDDDDDDDVVIAPIDSDDNGGGKMPSAPVPAAARTPAPSKAPLGTGPTPPGIVPPGMSPGGMPLPPGMFLPPFPPGAPPPFLFGMPPPGYPGAHPLPPGASPPPIPPGMMPRPGTSPQAAADFAVPTDEHLDAQNVPVTVALPDYVSGFLLLQDPPICTCADLLSANSDSLANAFLKASSKFKTIQKAKEGVAKWKNIVRVHCGRKGTKETNNVHGSAPTVVSKQRARNSELSKGVMITADPTAAHRTRDAHMSTKSGATHGATGAPGTDSDRAEAKEQVPLTKILSSKICDFLASENIVTAEELLESDIDDIKARYIAFRKDKGMAPLKADTDVAKKSIIKWRYKVNRYVGNPSRPYRRVHQPGTPATSAATEVPAATAKIPPAAIKTAEDDGVLEGVLSKHVLKFLRSMGVNTATEFLRIDAQYVADSYVEYRKKKGKDPLKGVDGPRRAVNKWRQNVRDASQHREQRQLKVAAKGPLACALSDEVCAFLKEKFDVATPKAFLAIDIPTLKEAYVKYRTEKGLPPLKSEVVERRTVTRWRFFVNKQQNKSRVYNKRKRSDGDSEKNDKDMKKRKKLGDEEERKGDNRQDVDGNGGVGNGAENRKGDKKFVDADEDESELEVEDCKLPSEDTKQAAAKDNTDCGDDMSDEFEVVGTEEDEDEEKQQPQEEPPEEPPRMVLC